MRKRRLQLRRCQELRRIAAAAESLASRRYIERTVGGWSSSTLAGYLAKGDELTYKLNFRMTKRSVQLITDQLSAAGHVVDSKCRNKKLRVTAAFKVAVCLYYLAGHGKGDRKVVGDVASLGCSTVESYLRSFCVGVVAVLKPVYMPSEPPSEQKVASWRGEFGARRGITNVAMAVDGTHCPFRGGNDYRNYKGWSSILLLAFVDPFYCFIDGDVGACGRAGDNTVLDTSWIMAQIRADPEAWLGIDGVIAADNGASDSGEHLLNPIPNADDPVDLEYNFCHSSTSFPVEETFGRFKNRFRFLLYQCDLSHARYVELVYTAMILHNLCTILKDDAVDFTTGADDEWEAFWKTYRRHACPTCVRNGKLHCMHSARNRAAPAAAKNGGSSAMRDELKDRLWAAKLAEEGLSEESL